MDGFTIELNEEQRMVRSTAEAFAKDSVAPLAKKVDAEHYFPEELIPELGKLGFLGVFVPTEYGGSELDYISYSCIVEALARHCASTSVILSAHNSLAIWPILAFGSEEQKKRYLPSLSEGKSLGCFALSEPGTGSDAAAQSCRCLEESDGWRISGVKNWITNGPVADVCILFAMNDPAKGHKGICAFIVDLKEHDGIEIGKLEDKLGICGSPTASISFDSVLLPKSALLAKVGDGFKVAMATLDGGRIGIAAQAVGIARAALEESVSYAKERVAFGKTIAQHQSIQNYLADMSTSIDAARLLCWNAARLKDAGQAYTRQAAQAKLFASETAVGCALKGIQIHGGYGYVKEYPVERYLRDAKITEIYEGTSEIQRLVISGALLRD